MIARTLFMAGLVIAGGCSAEPQAGTSEHAAQQAATGKPFAEAVVADFDAPWAMTFLPDGRMLVTEKDGRLLLVAADGGRRSVIATLTVCLLYTSPSPRDS